MKKLAWLTDTHLMTVPDCKLFSEFDGLIISGDIANGTRIKKILSGLAQKFDKPIWFVLGEP